MLRELRNFKKIIGGTNCYVYKCDGYFESCPSVETKKMICKFGGDGKLDNKVGEMFINDYTDLYEEVIEKGIPVPLNYQIFLKNGVFDRYDVKFMDDFTSEKGKYLSVVIVEEYKGVSIRDYLRDGAEYPETEELLTKTIEFIQCLPEDVPLDIHPGNITYDKERFFFVDLVPPYPWKYSLESDIGYKLSQAFKSIRTTSYEEARKRSYFGNNYRVKKFMGYVKMITQPN